MDVIKSRISDVIRIITPLRVNLTVEKITQVEIHKALTGAGLPFLREYDLDGVRENIPDLFLGGIAIEIKIKGAKSAIFKQCERYCAFSDVKVLILCSGRPMGMPPEIDGKPVYFINLSIAYL